MRIKILALGLVCLCFILSCDKKIKNPYSPEVPQYDTYTVQLQIGVGATLSPTYVFNVYGGTNDVLLKVLTIPAGDVGTGTVNVSASFEMLKTSSEETFPVKWKLMSCSLGSAWASDANYGYWMTVVPVSSGITIDPPTQQRSGAINGWNIGDVKQLTFKIKKS